MYKPVCSSSLVLALGLGGCAAEEPAPDPIPTPESVAATHEQIRGDLDSLRALDVFYVGHIIRDLPEEATSCYFDDIGPRACPGWEDTVAAADAAIAPKLAQLVATATDAAAEVQTGYPTDAQRIADDLAALRGLQIVEIHDLVVAMPDNNPNCYNLPCPEDQAKADAENALRAARLDAITGAVAK